MLSPGGYVRQGPADKRNERPARAVNVQVAVRCRPLNDRERRAGDRTIVQCDASRREIHFAPPNARKTSGAIGGKKTFTYDHVFGPDATQRTVYEGVVQPIVEEVLEGYNCTVFAYGQTGTGKTHTMEGQRDSDSVAAKRLPKNAGMIPRAVQQIFEHLRNISDEHSVKVSHLEMYNEQLTDLLVSEDETSTDLRMFEDSAKGVFVNGLDEHVVKSEEEIFEILDRSALKRKTAETQMNKYSSRSHSVFSITIHIKQSSPDGSDLLKVGKLNLVDLAGSENVGRSGAVKGRAREAGNINQSLLTLGRVITALVEHHPHIPYRDSKLTRLLQESLGGRNKTCVIATATPGSGSYEETASTLDYAYRAKSIKNRPTVNQMIAKHVLLKDYTDEIAKLKRELDHARQKHGVFLPSDEYERLMESTQDQGTQIEELLEKVAENEKLYTECEENLANTRADAERLQDELGQKAELLQATEKKLRERSQELDEERVVCAKYKTQASDYLVKGKDMQSTLRDVISDNNALHTRVEEHKKIDGENSKRLDELRETLVKNHEHHNSVLVEYEAKHEQHMNLLKAQVGEFVSNASSAVNDVLENFEFYNEHIQTMETAHGEISKKFEDGILSRATAFEQVSNENIEAQLKRFVSFSDEMSAGCNSLNSALQTIASGIDKLDTNYKSFESKHAEAFQEFASEQKAKLDRTGSIVSVLLQGHESRLSNLKDTIITRQATQAEQLRKMQSEVMSQVSQILSSCIASHTAAAEHAVNESNSIIDQAVEASKSCRTDMGTELGKIATTSEEFASSMRSDIGQFTNELTGSVATITETVLKSSNDVSAQAQRATELAEESRDNELKHQSSISDHCKNMSDLVQTRGVVRSEEKTARFELLSEATDRLTSGLNDLKVNTSNHVGAVTGSLEQQASLSKETQTTSRDTVTQCIVAPGTKFEIARDTEINAAPVRKDYVYPQELDELADREQLIRMHRDENMVVQPPAETTDDALETNKELPGNESAASASASASASDSLSEAENMDIYEPEPTPSIETTKASSPVEPVKSSVLGDCGNFPDTTNITVSRKRRAETKTKSRGIRRPKMLATSKSTKKK